MLKLFEKKFTVVEVVNGKRYEYHLTGSKEEIRKDIEAFKDVRKDYKMVEKSNRLVIWIS